MMDRQEHIDRIARSLGCTVKQAPRVGGMMFVEFGYVTGPIIETQQDYLALLHELGHFALGHTQGRPPHTSQQEYFTNGVLKSEAQAWEWALGECEEVIESTSRYFMWDYCLGSYYQRSLQCGKLPTRITNGDRHHVEFVFDTSDEYFASIVHRIQGVLDDFQVPFPDRMPEVVYSKLYAGDWWTPGVRSLR